MHFGTVWPRGAKSRNKLEDRPPSTGRKRRKAAFPWEKKKKHTKAEDVCEDLDRKKTRPGGHIRVHAWEHGALDLRSGIPGKQLPCGKSRRYPGDKSSTTGTRNGDLSNSGKKDRGREKSESREKDEAE